MRLPQSRPSRDKDDRVIITPHGDKPPTVAERLALFDPVLHGGEAMAVAPGQAPRIWSFARCPALGADRGAPDRSVQPRVCRCAMGAVVADPATTDPGVAAATAHTGASGLHRVIARFLPDPALESTQDGAGERKQAVGEIDGPVRGHHGSAVVGQRSSAVRCVHGQGVDALFDGHIALARRQR
jgi:hypothetical protein